MPKLIFPQEIEVWYILPAIRKKIAIKLIEKGSSQKKVAELMGVTEAAISQYKSQKRAKEEIFDKEMEKELEKAVLRIKKNEDSLSQEIISLNNLAKSRGILCKIYHEVCILKKCKKQCTYCGK